MGVSAGKLNRIRNSGRTILALACLGCLLLALSACSDETEKPEVEPYPPPNPLLYEIANSNGEVEGWMLGTIHALPDGVVWRTPEIDHVASDADILVVEVASLRRSDALRQIFLELSQTGDLPPISERVSVEYRPDLETMLERSDLSRNRLRNTEDWGAAIMLAQVDAPGRPRNGVDRALIADFDGRDVRGLETARGQLGVFDTLAAQDQRDLLEGTIAEWAASRDDPERLLRAWLSGNAQVLERATTEGIMADSELHAALLVDRNNRWMDELLPILEAEPKPFIAVGAAHLFGPEGLTVMLEDAGYTLERLPAS